MGKRLIYILLIFPFIIASVLVMIASAVYWLFTGKTLMYVIDWMVLEMKNLEENL